jgi:hypothetical protein
VNFAETKMSKPIPDPTRVFAKAIVRAQRAAAAAITSTFIEHYGLRAAKELEAAVVLEQKDTKGQ